MKKLLLVPIALLTQLSFAVTEPTVNDAIDTALIQDVINFKKIEKKHTDDWLQQDLKRYQNKNYLLKKHHDEWINWKVKKLQAMNKVNSFAELNALITTELDEAISLHQQQRQEWHTTCKKQYDAEVKLFNDQENELKKFESKHYLK